MKNKPPSKIKLFTVGDLLPGGAHRPFFENVQNEAAYKDISALTSKHDINFFNLECPLTIQHFLETKPQDLEKPQKSRFLRIPSDFSSKDVVRLLRVGMNRLRVFRKFMRVDLRGSIAISGGFDLAGLESAGVVRYRARTDG